MASSSAVSAVSGIKVESSVRPGGEIVSEGGTDGACASSCTVRLPRLVVPAGWPVGGWYRVLFFSRGPFAPPSPVGDKQKGRGSRVGFRGPEGAGLIENQAGSLQGSGPRKAHIVWCCFVCFRDPAPAAAKA